MFIAYLVFTLLAIVANAYSAILDFSRPQKILLSMAKLGVPEPWLPVLGLLKVAGAVGLLIGFRFPVIGTAAAIGLTLYFAGAIITHLRAKDYSLGAAAVFLLLAGSALVTELFARGFEAWKLIPH
jgi:hypothetical protein